ncbi:MAG: hypothetical protein ACKVPX_02515 [Myxococcaceae bacterium]
MSRKTSGTLEADERRLFDLLIAPNFEWIGLQPQVENQAKRQTTHAIQTRLCAGRSDLIAALVNLDVVPYDKRALMHVYAGPDLEHVHSRRVSCALGDDLIKDCAFEHWRSLFRWAASGEGREHIAALPRK